MNIDEAADAVFASYGRNARPAESLRGRLDVEQACRVQRAVMDRLLDGGEIVAGWKIGGNSEAARKVFGEAAPFSGFLLESGRRQSGDEFDLATFPGAVLLECELAFIFKAPLRGEGVTRSDVQAAVGEIAPALEIAGVGRVPGLDLGLLIADNVAQWNYVLGRPVTYSEAIELGSVEVVAQRNGEVALQGVSRDCIDNQLDSVAWLVGHLARQGLSIEAGQIVMTGSCLKPEPVARAEHWQARFSGFGEVEARFR